MKQIRERKRLSNLVFVVGPLILIATLIGLTYAFFNYTRTGTANVIRTGQINFSTTQSSGESGAISLNNVFPVDVTGGIPTNNPNVGSVTINVTGDTEYTGGIEYLVTATSVVNTVNGKHVPISINVTATSGLGTADSSYFDNHDTNPQTSIYKVLASDVIEEDEQLLVGYIKSGQTGVNGDIVIKAYIDADKIAISDTYYENAPTPTPTSTPLSGPNDEYGTTTEWVDDRVVLTTTEWNNIQSSGVSFQVKVEANEGTWVEGPLSRNDMINIFSSNTFTSEQKSSITEINFIRMSETEINTHANLIDLTADGGEGIIKAWIDGTKLYIASPGETYFPVNSTGLLYGFSNVMKINFNNINTSLVTNMTALLNGNTSLTNIDLSSFDTGNVVNMQAMFGNSGYTSLDLSVLNTSRVENMSSLFMNDANLVSVNLSDLGNNNLTTISGMFSDCTNLTNIDMSGFNFGTASVVGFLNGSSNAPNLEIIDLSDITINTNNMTTMFADKSHLTTIYVSNAWDVSGITYSNAMFDGCTSLVGQAPNTSYAFDDTDVIDKTYARIATDDQKGYLTDISLKPTS